MNAWAIVASVWPTFNVPGIRFTGTTSRTLNTAPVRRARAERAAPPAAGRALSARQPGAPGRLADVLAPARTQLAPPSVLPGPHARYASPRPRVAGPISLVSAAAPLRAGAVCGG